MAVIKTSNAVEEKIALSLCLPKKYKVILLNDDYTPMDFVVNVLTRFFYLSESVATRVMLQVHQQGRGVCGVFTHDIAETKMVLVNEYARENQHPLLACIEPCDDGTRGEHRSC